MNIEQQALQFIKQHRTPDIRFQYLEGQVIVSSDKSVKQPSTSSLLEIFNAIGTPGVKFPPLAVTATIYKDVPQIVSAALALGLFLDLDVSIFEDEIARSKCLKGSTTN